MSVRLSTISGNLTEIESSRRSKAKEDMWETYKIANLCAQFMETVSIPTRCTGGRWRYCLGPRGTDKRDNNLAHGSLRGSEDPRT